MQQRFIQTASSSPTPGHIKSGEQECSHRNSVGMLACIKSSQPEGLKVSLVSSHTAFIRGDRGNEWTGGENERVEKWNADKLKMQQKLGKCVFVCCVPAVSAIRSLVLISAFALSQLIQLLSLSVYMDWTFSRCWDVFDLKPLFHKIY